MDKIFRIFIVMVFVFSLSPLWANDIAGLHNQGYVVVSPNGPDDGGDYGPNTPNTQTSGIQEAFNYAKANDFKQVYIIGGGATGTSAPVTYVLNTTLTIPWFQNWQCDGGNYVMNFTMTSGDCLVIDSQMNCFFRFGTIIAPNLQSGSIVKISPVTAGPDTYITHISCITNIAAIKGKGKDYGTGLSMTGTGGIGGSKFMIGQISDCQIGLQMNNNVNGNEINCNLIRRCGTMIKANPGSGNTIYAGMKVDGAAGTIIGASIESGQQSFYTLAWLDSFASGNSLIFGSGAQDNLVYAMNLPVIGVTNNATVASNRIVPLKSAGYSVTTPAMPSSNSYVTNRTSYSVVSTILTGGSVSDWTMKDSAGTTQQVNGGLLAGQTFYLEPGDSIKFSYSAAPTWVWRAIR